MILTYLMVSSGFVVCLHYCMDKYDSFGIGSSADTECSKCGMHKDGGCCSDEVLVVKVENSHMASPGIHADEMSQTLTTIHTEYLLSPFRNFFIQRYSVSHSPPISQQDLYLDNCVFRI